MRDLITFSDTVIEMDVRLLTKLFRKRKAFAGVSGAAGPIDDRLYCANFVISPSHGSLRIRNGDDVRDVAGS